MGLGSAQRRAQSLTQSVPVASRTPVLRMRIVQHMSIESSDTACTVYDGASSAQTGTV